MLSVKLGMGNLLPGQPPPATLCIDCGVHGTKHVTQLSENLAKIT
jgi:hypothetical protein